MLCWSLTLVYLSHKNICALHHEKKSHNVDLFLDNKSSSTLNHFVFSTMKQSNIFILYPYIQRIRVVIHRKEFTLELCIRYAWNLISLALYFSNYNCLSFSRFLPFSQSFVFVFQMHLIFTQKRVYCTRMKGRRLRV